MKVAYPITPSPLRDNKATKDLDTIAMRSVKNTYSQLYQKEFRPTNLWNIVVDEDPDAILDASSKPGAVFGDTIDDLRNRIDRRRGAPVGTTSVVQLSQHVYAGGKSRPFNLFAEMPYFFIQNESMDAEDGRRFYKPPSCPRYSRWSHWHNGINSGDGQMRMQRLAKRVARNRGACFCHNVFTSGDTKLNVDEDGYVIETLSGGMKIIRYDPERNKRIRKLRHTLSKKRPGSDKTTEVQCTGKDALLLLLKEMLDICWVKEIKQLSYKHPYPSTRWESKSSRVAGIISNVHQLAVRLGLKKKIDPLYRKWLPIILKSRTFLKSYGVTDSFFSFVEKELERVSRKRKKKKDDAVGDKQGKKLRDVA